MLGLTYEKQVANSGLSRNPQNPTWKDNFVLYVTVCAVIHVRSNVSSIASGKLNLKVYNENTNRENLIAEGNILTAALEDEKQRTEVAELKGERLTGLLSSSTRS